MVTIVWMHETALEPGKLYDLKLATRDLAGKVSAIDYQVDVNTLEQRHSDHLDLNAIARCHVELTAPVPVDDYRTSPGTGSFILIDRLSNLTVGAGMIHRPLDSELPYEYREHDSKAQVVWNRTSVTQAMREQINGHAGKCVWFTDYSGSGKSTLANALEVELNRRGFHTMLLDDDNIRHGLCKDLGMSEADRSENIRRVGEVARLFAEAGIIVITKADEVAILAVRGALPTLEATTLPPASSHAWESYVVRYADWFAGQPLLGWRVGLYQHSAAGRDLNHQVLEALGAEGVVLGRSDSFVPVDTEAVGQADRERGQAWAEEHRLDALLSTDGDGDRPLLGDERGHWLRGDIVGLLCARELGIQALAVPVSCNTAIEACGAFQAMQRTRIGSPYVLDGMAELSRQHLRVAGFEANGGFLLGSDLQEGERQLSALPTRDALLPALTLMVAAAKSNVALSTLVAELPARYTASDRLQQVPTERSRELLASWAADTQAMRQALDLKAPIDSHDTTDGLRVTLQDGEIVHLRPSGNAPELRCYVEADSEDRAQALVEQVMGKLKTVFSRSSQPGVNRPGCRAAE